MLTAPRGVEIQHLHILCIQWILAAPGMPGRKASPARALGASGWRFGAGLLRTLRMNGKGMAKLPGMSQRQRGFGKRYGSAAVREFPGTEHAGTKRCPARHDGDKGAKLACWSRTAQFGPDTPIHRAGK